MDKFTESTVEEAVLEWVEGLEYGVLHGSENCFAKSRCRPMIATR